MADKHTSVKEGTRRRALPWDRIKVGILLVFILAAIYSGKVNGPFTTPSEAISEMWAEFWGRLIFILLGLEILRQIHYRIAERSRGYNQFWIRLFGGFENSVTERVSPWTRFRLGRYIRIFVFFLLLGFMIDYFVDDVSSPITALIQAPRILARNMQQFIFVLFLPLVLIGQFAALFWFLSRGGVQVTMADEIEKRYEDVWGQDHVLEMVRENMGFLDNPDEIEEKGGHVPGGLLLWGPPGTGKTLIAEATAGEVGVPFVSVEPSAFINMFMGVGPLKVKGLFRKLRKLSLRHGGVVAFFDEADSLGNRGNLAGGGAGQPMEIPAGALTCNGFEYLSPHAQNDIGHALGWSAAPAEEDSNRSPIHRIMMGGMGGGGGGMGTLQVLLSELSGLSKPRGITNRLRKAMGMKPKAPPKYRIFIMMASNLPEALDPALLRPGRLDRIYKVGYPSKDGRKLTFEGYLAKVDHVLTDDQVEDLAVKTPYYSGAKIKDIVNEALINAIRDDRSALNYDDVWKAKVHKELGPSDNTDYIDRERHAVAVHEACHAVVAHLTSTRNTIDLATIERHANSLGMVVPIQLEDRATRWRTEFEADVMVSLASLAGEKMFFEGDNSSGVSADLRNATAQASYMMGLYGMGESISSLAAMGQARFGTSDPSPDILRRMGPQVEELLEDLYERTEQLLVDYRDKVLEVAAALEERKTISGDDITEIMGSEPGVLAKDLEGSWLRVDPNRALLAAGNGEPAADEVTTEEPDEELDKV
jgi:ATP-dependent Zn protease